MFGPYRVEGLLGRGGMGEVHRAFDTRRNRTVALKRLPPELAAYPTFQARFRREAALVATLTDPHVVPIHDYGEIDGRLFLDMRLVQGHDLGHVLETHGPLRPDRAVDVVSQIASALDAAHAEQLVHRDVKPTNVLLTGPPDRRFCYLVDFGIARAAGDPSLTGAHEPLGTLAYMAPERFLEGEDDHRVDVYALGCLLYAALTGLPPFPGNELPTLMYAHLNAPPPEPSAHRPHLPVALDAVVVRALAKRPEQRYASTGELAVAARTALAGGPTARRRGGAWRPRRDRPAVPAPAGAHTSSPTAPIVLRTAPVAVPEPRRAPAPPTPAAGIPRRPAPPDGFLASRRRRALLGLLAVVAVAAAVAGGVLLWPRPGVPAGATPRAVALAPDGSRAYVVGDGTAGLSVVGLRAGVAGRHVGLDRAAQDVAVAPDGRVVYVTGDATVKVVDTAADAVTATIALPPVPGTHTVTDTAVSPDGATLYVSVGAGSGSATFAVDTATHAVVRTAPRGGALGLSRDGTRLYLADGSGIVAVDTARAAVVTEGTVDGRADRVAVAPDGGQVYAVGPGRLWTLDATTLRVTHATDLGSRSGEGVAVAPDGGRVYVPTDAGTVVAVDRATGAVVADVAVDTLLTDVAVAPDGHRLYVTSDHHDRLVAVDTATDTVAGIP